MKLGDICSKIGSGATPRGGKDSYKDYGIPIIRSQNVRDWAFSPSGLAFIDDDQARVLSSAVVEQGDVLLNITGDSVARVCKAPAEFESARVNQHVAIIRANENANNSFLLAWLQANKSLLLKLASSGATRNALTKGMLENLDVNLPSIDVQNKIAVLVDSIQAKIATNTKLNGYLA
ncbi:restriction endonuclease subunit S [Senegalimassilia anaerobia]